MGDARYLCDFRSDFRARIAEVKGDLRATTRSLGETELAEGLQQMVKQHAMDREGPQLLTVHFGLRLKLSYHAPRIFLQSNAISWFPFAS